MRNQSIRLNPLNWEIAALKKQRIWSYAVDRFIRKGHRHGYDFVSDDNQSVGGGIDESLSKEEAIERNRKFVDQPCRTSLLETTVAFKSGRVRTTYTLKRLEPLSEAEG